MVHCKVVKVIGAKRNGWAHDFNDPLVGDSAN